MKKNKINYPYLFKGKFLKDKRGYLDKFYDKKILKRIILELLRYKSQNIIKMYLEEFTCKRESMVKLNLLNFYLEN